MRTVAVLPVKRFALAKQRLGGAVAAPDRRTLAEAMVRDVLDALGRVEGIHRVVVVTAEPVAVAAARDAGAVVVHDDSEAGQSAAARTGVAEALRLGAERALLVPGDCPALDPGEITALLADDRPGPHAVVVPDRHGTGTNALVLTPPDAIAPAFGPDSFARHTAAARGAAATLTEAAVRSLGLDVDTADDLEALRAALAARPGGAPRTRRVLARGLTVKPAA